MDFIFGFLFYVLYICIFIRNNFNLFSNEKFYTKQMIREKQQETGPIVIDLTGPDGNAFALMGYAKRFAKQFI